MPDQARPDQARPDQALPDRDRPAEAPFAEPWQAQAFALTEALKARGLFSAAEWAEALGAEIAAAGPTDDGARYYEHWLAATEKLVARKGMASAAGLEERRAAWDRSARATPHGREIRLENDPLR